MTTCEHCNREFVGGRPGRFAPCPYCDWQNGSARYFLDRDPNAAIVEVNVSDPTRVEDYSEDAKREYR